MSAQLTLRTLSGGTSNTTKGATLTHAEMDQNFINLDNEIDGKLNANNPSFTGTLNESSGKLSLDSSGNLCIGASPDAWHTGGKVLQINSAYIEGRSTGDINLFSNAYINAAGSQHIYKTSAAASIYNQSGGAHRWFVAPSGTAGNPISFTQAMTLDAAGNLGLGVTPSAWFSGWSPAFEMRSYSVSSDANSNYVANNAVFGSDATWRYIASKYALHTQVDSATGQFRWFTAPSGTAGNPISFTQAMTLDASGNLSIAGQATFPNGTFSRPASAGQYIIGTDSGGLYNQVGSNYYAVITDENIASRIPAQTVQRNSSGYVIPENWIQLNGAYGLYSPINSAHFAVNDTSSYVPWRISGTKGGWAGIHFTDPNTTLMLSPDGTNVGFISESTGWKFRWSAGSLLCSKGTTGGGVEATVWDSSNLPISSSPSIGTVVQRDNNGYINTGYINTNTPEAENPAFSSMYVSSGDGYIRKATTQHVANTLAPIISPLVSVSGEETAKQIYSANHTWGNGSAVRTFIADILVNGSGTREVFCSDEFIVETALVDYYWVNTAYQGLPDAVWAVQKAILMPNTDPGVHTTRLRVTLSNSTNSQGPMMYYPETLSVRIKKIGQVNQVMTLTNIQWA